MTAGAYSGHETSSDDYERERSHRFFGWQFPVSWAFVRLVANIAIVLALFASAEPAAAQVTAAISGRVEDPTGAGVGGATVTVKSFDTGATRTVRTDDAGSYRVLSLPLGPQELKVEKPGFKSAVRAGINLVVGQEAVVNVRLEVGEYVQQVTVSEDVPVVNATTADVSGLVTENQVRDLPLNGRSFDNLITLNPGTINYSAMKSPQTSTSNGNTFSVAGRRTSENLFLLNGIEYTGSSQLAITPGGTSGYLLGIDAVREFNVLTDTYSAEYGKRAGAQVSVVTRSGTNVLHGTLFEFLRNSALNARDPFTQGSEPPPFRQNQFGGALGGPLVKDRWFLFGNYEGFRQALDVNNIAVVPDAQARQGILPPNVISGSFTLNPAMLPYMALWPAPNGPELLRNGVPSGTAFAFNNPKQSIREDFGTSRTDYRFSNRDTFSGAYTIDDGTSLVPLGDPLFASFTTLRMQVASLQETHIFSAGMLNTVRAGFSRAAFNLNSAPLASFPPSLSFVNGEWPGGIVINGGVTTTVTSSITAAGSNNAAGSWNRRNLFTFTDDFQMVKGRHEISIGVWFQPLQDNENSASRQLGQATFTSLQTFLQGTVSSFQVVPSANALGWRSLLGAWYAQDTVKLQRNVSLEAGLRYEFTTGWNEEFGRAANYVTDASGVLATNPIVGNSAFTKNDATHLLGPRMGIAWDVFGNGKTAIRAGAGMYYSLIDDLAFLLNSLPPANGAVSYSNRALASVLPVIRGVPPAPSCGPGVPQPCTIFAPQGVQADAQTPAVGEWHMTFEQQLDPETVLRVGYAGSHGYHGLLSLDPNAVPAQICAAPAGCVSGGVGSAKGAVPEGTQYIPVVASRPNPFLGAGFFWYTEGNSSYNALEIDVQRRFSRGFELRGNYTWSKNLDDNSALTGAQANNQPQMVLDRTDVSRDWGPSALNVASQASISGIYELPFGKGKTWLANARGVKGQFINGWQMNGIVALLSGFPITPLIGTNRSGDGDIRNPDRPSWNPNFNGPVILGKPNEWFNPNAFILPAPGTYGNVGRGVLTGPGTADLDLSVFKDFAVSEKSTLQFRVECFNTLNRSNYGVPNTTVFSNGAISASAGLITTTTTPARQIQLALKLLF
jgi:hypothetical protein